MPGSRAMRPCKPRLGSGWQFNRIPSYQTLPKTQLELPILNDSNHQQSDDREVELATGQMGDRLRWIDSGFSLDALRRKFERPSEDQC